MNPCFVSIGAVLALMTVGLSQEAGRRGTNVDLLERELLAHPCFERPFYDVMTETLDRTAWGNLDARWQKLQVTNPRYTLLRAMLAERQGNFDTALRLYESVREDDWGAYHYGRFLAFWGRTQDAKHQLLKVVEAASDPWLFREAARGVGEVILLQEGVEAAVQHYAMLWEKHKPLELRMTLLEPLLTLRIELGRGAAWLESMRPAFTPGGIFDPTETELDQGILWHWGNMLTHPQNQRRSGQIPQQLDETALYGLLLFAGPRDDWFNAAVQHRDIGRWQGCLDLEQGFHTLSKAPLVQLESLARHPQTAFHALESALSYAANEGAETFLQAARTLRSQLRERPWLAMRTTLLKADRIHSAHERLAREIFADSNDAVWQLISLLLRMTAGSKPEELKADALALWYAVAPEQRLMVREDMPPKLRSGPHDHLLEQLGGNPHQEGCWCPLSSVVWNLRGSSFIAVMRNRFAFENQKLFAMGTTTRGLSLPPKGKGGNWYLGSLPDIETGTQLRFVLWLLRDQLGLNQTSFGKTGEEGKDATEHALDVLIRGTQAETCRFLIDAPKLSELPAAVLLTFQKTITLWRSAGTAPEVCETAAARVADALLEQRPDWFVTSLVEQRPLVEAPVLDAGQSDDLLMACGHMAGHSEAARITSLQNWRKLIPAITDERSLQAELEGARQRLGTKALPHALWGLQWQPSLRRQVAVASPDYISQRSSRTYLTQTLPRALEGRGNLESMIGLVQPFADEVSFKLMQLFGLELLTPQPFRSPEIRDYAGRHPRARDLLKAWDIMQVELPVDDSLQTFRYVHPVKQAALMKVLEAPSSSADARLTLAMLHRWHGDANVPERLWKEANGTQGPLHMLSTLVPQQAALAPSLASDYVEHAKRIFDEVKKPEPAKSLALRMARSNTERQALYEWLRREVKPTPAYARQIAVMAELARMLKLSGTELAAAEQLDLQVNRDDPLVWVQRGISHAKEGEDDQAVDLFIEAVRRTDFTNPPAYLYEHSPPKPSWLERVKNAGCLGKLASALSDSLRSSPPGSADDMAASILETIIQGGDILGLTSQLKPLLDVVLKRDRHLLLARFEALAEASKAAERRGEGDMAALLARMSLRGVWPVSLTQKEFRNVVAVNGVPRAVYLARSSWSEEDAPDEVSPNAPIATVLRLALQGDDVPGFIADLTKDAKQFPEDEHIISCALVVQARHGRLGGDALDLMNRLTPLARMRTAWRLCEYGPASNSVLAKVAPVLSAGLRETFQSKKHERDGVPGYQLAAKVVPWIERAGAATELRGLVKLFAEKLNDNLWPMCWRLTAGMAAKHASPEEAQEITIRWWEHCFRAMNRRGQPIEWFIETMEEVCTLVQDPYNTTPEPFADLADELWRNTLTKFPPTEDPPVKMAWLLCDALVATGRANQLKSLDADMETILQLDGDEVYTSVRDRIRQGLALLDSDGQSMFAPLIWINEGGEGGSGATVTWRLVVPLKMPDNSASELLGYSPVISGEWVVPHFLKGVYELEVFVGDSPAALNPMAKVKVDRKAGTVRLAQLPPSGWVRAVVRNASTSTVNFGRPEIYCLTKPLLDSTSLGAATPPQWEDEVVGLYGRPISSLASIENGIRIMITDFTQLVYGHRSLSSHEPSVRAEVHLVGLNDDGAPIGILPLRQYLERRPDGTNVVLIDPEKWSGTNGLLQMPQPGMPRSKAAPSHLVMTTFADPNELLQCLRVQTFAKAALAPARQAEPTALVARPVADLGFPIARWRLNEELPRAAFVGDGVLAVYDTTSTPWKELLRYHDVELRADVNLFMMHPEAICVMTASREHPEASKEIWQLRCDGSANPVTLRECPKVTLPFLRAQSALSPDERSCIFVSAPADGKMRVALLDGSHALKLLQIDTSSARTSSPTLIARWSDNQAAVIKLGDTLFHVRVQAGELRLDHVEKAPFEAVMPDLSTLSYYWTLKRAQLLVRTDRTTGEMLGAYRLPEECVGKAMWWSIKNRAVLLQTRQHELITVMPLTGKTSQ